LHEQTAVPGKDRALAGSLGSCGHVVLPQVVPFFVRSVTPFAGHIACIGKRSCPAKVHAFCGSHRLHRQTFVPGKGCAAKGVTPFAGHAVCTSKRLRPAKVAPFAGSRRLHEQAPAPGKSRALAAPWV